MGLRGKPPREKGDGAGNWTHDRCPGGSERTGWLAGDIHGLECHPSERTLPCVKDLIGPDARCEYCEVKRWIPKWLGFVPVYRHDGRPMVIVIQDWHREFVQAIPLHRPIVWKRARGEGEGIEITLADSTRPWISTLPERNRPADLSLWLARIWRRPDLAPYLVKRFAVVDAGQELPMTPGEAKEAINQIKTDAGEGVKAVLARTFVTRGGSREPAMLGDVLPVPSVNGTHHDPPPRRKR